MAGDDDLHEVREQIASLAARLSVIEERLRIPEAAPKAPPPPIEAPAPAPPPKLQTTIETTIGAHWLNRIGIAAVLIGAAFFLKYAFENNWIGPGMRVLSGVAAGVVLIVWAQRFHARGHQLFAHTLDVVGNGILYLSIWAASQTYALIPISAAFAAMVIVTAAVVGLSIRHRSEFLAGVALTGGFLTPVLLSTGVNREIELFAYIAILDIATLVLLAIHPWVRALGVAFF